MNSNNLTKEQLDVLKNAGTEAPYSGKYVTKQADGMYHCVGCDQALFSTNSQYESKLPGLLGWPSFSQLADSEAVTLKPDRSLATERTEVVCSNCQGHLGHLFDDPYSPTGKHYCINSCVLELRTKKANK